MKLLLIMLMLVVVIYTYDDAGNRITRTTTIEETASVSEEGHQDSPSGSEDSTTQAQES